MEDGIMASDDKSDIQIMSFKHIASLLTHSNRFNTYRLTDTHIVSTHIVPTLSTTHIVNEVPFLIEPATATYNS